VKVQGEFEIGSTYQESIVLYE